MSFNDIYSTVASVLCSFGLGMAVGIIGPTLVNLEYILQTDTQGMGFSFIGENIGIIIGAAIAGFMFDKLNSAIQLAIAGNLLAILLAMAPWMSNLYIYYIVIAVQNVAHGFLESSLQTYILRLWKGRKFLNTAMHILFTAETMGTCACPFVVIPFLASFPIVTLKPLLHDYDYAINVTPAYDFTDYNDTNLNITLNSEDEESTDYFKVRYAYAIVACVILFASCMFYFLAVWKKYCRLVKTSFNEDSEGNESDSLQTPVKSTNTETTPDTSTGNQGDGINNATPTMLLLFMVALFVGVAMMPEYTFGSYISTFVIKGLGWRSTWGALLTSVFRGSQAIGQVIAIPISIILKPGTTLLINMILGSIAFVCILVYPFVSSSHIMLWISVGFAGLSISTMYTGGVLWGAQNVKVTAKYGSVIVISTAIGGIVEAALTGYLMQHRSHMWLIYLCLAAFLFNLILFTLMKITTRYIKTAIIEINLNDVSEEESPAKESLLEINGTVS